MAGCDAWPGSRCRNVSLHVACQAIQFGVASQQFGKLTTRCAPGKWNSSLKKRWNGGTSDRKSTRLNSSHGYISYAVFCLKKKNTTIASSTSLEEDSRATRNGRSGQNVRKHAAASAPVRAPVRRLHSESRHRPSAVLRVTR